MKTHSLQNKSVELGIDEDGGHLWPVRFRGNRAWFEPMHQAQWANEDLDGSVPMVLRKLRGDFFAAPFGASDLDPSESLPHGATANGRWKLSGKNETSLELLLEKQVLGASVTKRIFLNPGEPVVYQEHEFHGGNGNLPVGYHAMLRVQSESFLSCSPRIWSGTAPVSLEPDPERGRSLLAYPQEFASLSKVQSANGDTVSLEEYPKFSRHEDIAMLTSDPREKVAWFAVVNPDAGWLWFSLKSPRTLPSTILWMSNGGRFYPPFSGRHTNVLGVEEAVSYFHLGHRASTEANPLHSKGIPTFIRLKKGGTVRLRYAFGAVSIPKDYTKVVSCQLTPKGITFADTRGVKRLVKVAHSFLTGETADTVPANESGNGDL